MSLHWMVVRQEAWQSSSELANLPSAPRDFRNTVNAPKYHVCKSREKADGARKTRGCSHELPVH